MQLHGRDAELAALSDLLDQARLLNPPGLGEVQEAPGGGDLGRAGYHDGAGSKAIFG